MSIEPSYQHDEFVVPEMDEETPILKDVESSTRPPKPYSTLYDIYQERIYLKYFWKILLLIGGFYLVPSVQFVVYQANSGSIDCYYNFKCKKDLGSIPAFNNIISNIFYLLAGLVFFIIVRLTRQKEDDGVHGLHNDMSLYYSLAIVLGFEGLFSGLYHVCPSRLNFQFDSTFMMVGVALLIVAIFQKRHAAKTIGAPRFYAFLAFLTIANSVTLFTGAIGVIIWIAVFVVLLYVLIAGSIHIYYHKTLPIDRSFPKIVWGKFKSVLRGDIDDKPRFILLVVANTVTVVVAIVGASRVSQFADYVLSVFMCNVMLYVLYYVGMKLYCKEKINPWVYVLFVASLGFMIASLHFFNIAVTDKLLTPEESRELNQPCVLFDYFDAHDVWHFLSAVAIFLLLILLYILDMGLEGVERTQIKVF